MSTTTTTPPPVHHYEEDFSRSNAFLAWLKSQYALYILAALLLVATLTRGTIFWSGTNMTNLLLQMSIIGVVVLAELIVVLTGGIDISVGSALGLAAVVAAGLFSGPSVFLGLVVALVIGGIIGAVNGWLVAFRGLEPFIVTLGMLALARGLVYAYGNGIPIIPQVASTYATIGQTTVLGVPVLALIWILAVAGIGFALNRTVWGRRVYAVGSNKEAARSSGIPVKSVLWSVYILAGLLVGLGGFMFLCRFGAGTSTAGNLMELEAIAAVVIGGARLAGGYGKVFGAVVGTIIFAVIANLLSLLNVSTFLQDAFRGALILVAVTLATVQFARKRAAAKYPNPAGEEHQMTIRTRSRGLIRLAAAVTALAALTACGQIYPSKEPAQGPAGGVQTDVNQVVIGFAQQQLQAPYFAAMQVQAEEIAAEQGFKLLFQAANKDPVVQMNQMQAMMTQGANVLLVNATSPKGQVEMMNQVSSKIPVIYIDTSVPGTGTTSVQFDNLAIGRESGKLTAARFKELGKDSINLVIVTGPATDEVVGPNRRQGFLDGLKEGGVTYKIKSEQNGEYQQDKGQVAAENMLAANPDTDLVLGLNDSMALGAYNVIQGKPQYKDVYIAASADGQREALALIKQGCDSKYISTGLNSPDLATHDALEIAIDIATGKTKPADYPPESFTKAVGIGCQNVAEFYDPNSIF